MTRLSGTAPGSRPYSRCQPSSLDPRMKIKDMSDRRQSQVHARALSRKEARLKTEQALRRVGLGNEILSRFLMS